MKQFLAISVFAVMGLFAPVASAAHHHRNHHRHHSSHVTYLHHHRHHHHHRYYSDPYYYDNHDYSYYRPHRPYISGPGISVRF